MIDLAELKLNISKLVRDSSKIPFIACFTMLVERFRVFKNVGYYYIFHVINKKPVKLIKYTTVLGFPAPVPGKNEGTKIIYMCKITRLQQAVNLPNTQNWC